jgi:hypothetical protein
MNDEKKQKKRPWKFWEKAPSAEEQLDRIQLSMYEEAMRLEKARTKRKRIYEV